MPRSIVANCLLTTLTEAIFICWLVRWFVDTVKQVYGYLYPETNNECVTNLEPYCNSMDLIVVCFSSHAAKPKR